MNYPPYIRSKVDRKSVVYRAVVLCAYVTPQDDGPEKEDPVPVRRDPARSIRRRRAERKKSPPTRLLRRV